MKRIEKFGSLSINQKLSVLKDKLGEDEILLFQYYEIGDNSNVSQEEYLDILKKFPLFSCVSLRNGEKLNNFSYGYVIQETAEDYDLLIYKNEEC